jgi:release factor glutamine methyltransferase
MWSQLVKSVSNYTLRPGVRFYLRANRNYTYRGITICVEKGIFHPGFFFSTRFLLHQLEKEELNGKTLLELGCGSGLISICAAKRGARVTATDINVTAITALQSNLNRLGMDGVQLIWSDLFQKIPSGHFDHIIINPPYFPRNPLNDEERAWYCGENFGYFAALFSQVGAYMHKRSRVWMSLSDQCDLDRIRALASANGFGLHLLAEKRNFMEKQYIYSLQK